MSEPTSQVMPPGSVGVETLSELLSCYICADRLRDASLCPHCSKMGCYTCIKRWVTKNRANCPHCRAPLTESSLIRVPFFDDLRHELEQLPTNPLEGNQQFKERLCSHHREKVSVYCETCRLCICHECVLWENSPHHNHTFIKLEVLLQKQTKICEAQLRRLHEHIKGVLNQVQFVERKMEAVKGTKIKVLREMKDAFEKMTERLESQYENKQQRLGDCRQKLKGQAMQITRVTRELENKLANGSITSLLNEQGELRKDVLDKLNKLQSMEIEPIPSIGELFNEMVPSYSTGVFKIHPYTCLKQQGDEVYSKPLHVCGTVWKLKVYPNGHHEDTGVYLSAFLELTEGFERTIKYQYCIEMLYNCSNKHPSRNYKKEYVSDFKDGESWGYRRFYELAKLENDGYLRDDMVVLRFSVRALTNHQKCKDLSAHVRRLEHKVEILQKELKAKKEAVSSSSTNDAVSTTPAKNETIPANFPHSPSRSRFTRHQHSHSHSDPISPGPRDGRHSPREREDRHREREHEQAVKREQERRRSEERHQEQERQYDQDRRREGVRRRGERAYRDHHLHVAMSQQHTMRNHSQNISGGSPVKRGYTSQQRHSDSRLSGLEPPPPPQQISYHGQRRDSGEGLRQHRRRSADPTMLQHHFDNPISPPSYRHTLAPPLPHVSTHEHLHFRHDSVGSSTEDSHYGEEFGSQASLSRHNDTRSPRFEEVSGDDEGGSQPHPWGEALSHTDIQITIPDISMHHPVSSTQPPRKSHHGSHHHIYHNQSQEQFIDEDETLGGGGRVIATDTMLGGPLSSQFQYYDQYDDITGHLPNSKCDMPSHTSALSQPVMSTKRRLQSSVPDLSVLTVTSNSNLTHSQCLSQSVLDMPRHPHRSGGMDHIMGFRPYHDMPRVNMPSRHTSQSYHGHLNRMPSDSHLNSEGVQHPGLQRTMLVRLREVPEHSPTTQHRRQQHVDNRTLATLPAKKGYRETRNKRLSPSPQPIPVEPQTSKQSQEEIKTSGIGPALKPTSSSGSSGSNTELTPTNPQPPPHLITSPPDTIISTSPPSTSYDTAAMTTGSQFLGLAGKSSSNTSLSNLNLI